MRVHVNVFSKPRCSEGKHNKERRGNVFEVTCCVSNLTALLAHIPELNVLAEGVHWRNLYRDLSDTLPAPAPVFPALFFPSLEFLAIHTAFVLLSVSVLSYAVPIAVVLPLVL